MYYQYYGFLHKPFELQQDPNVIFLSETHQEALSVLRYGVLNRKGFLQLTGNVGTGKSTLLQRLIQSLDSKTHLCYIPNPNLTVQEFYYFLAAKFGLAEYDGNKAKFVIAFGRFLQQCNEQNEHVLLIIDEAQVLSLDVLEEIRLISNQELYDDFGVLSIFFVGQPEFNVLLDHKKLLPLRNRIGISFHINPLTQDETTAYILFRLRKAGRRTPLFTLNAYRETYQASGGNPRTINILCDNALLEGFADQNSIIDENIIKRCAREIKYAAEGREALEEKTLKTVAIKEITFAEPIPDKKKEPGSFSLGRVAMAVLILVGIFMIIATSKDYWGRFPEAAPVKAWFDNLPIEKKIIDRVKKLFIDEKTKDVLPPAEKALKPPGRALAPTGQTNDAEKPPYVSSVDAGSNDAGAIKKTKEIGLQPVMGDYAEDIIQTGAIDPAERIYTNMEAPEEKIEIVHKEDGSNYVLVTRQYRLTVTEADLASPERITNNTLSEVQQNGNGYASITSQVEWVNIRSGPSMQHDIIRIVESGFPLLILDQKGEWSQVEDFKFRKGWVANKLIEENNSNILKIAKGNMRSGPSLNSTIAGVIDHGTIIRIMESQGSWVKVKTKTGIEGWIHKWSIWP